MKNLFLFACIVINALLFNGCSKDNDDNNNIPDGKNMKFTITTTGLQATDDFFMVFTGSVTDGSTTTLFKVNGQVQSNTIDIQITKEQLMAGTVTIESTTPLYVVAGNVSGNSGIEGHTFTYKLQAEVGGKAQPDKSATITTTSYSEPFTYSGK